MAGRPKIAGTRVPTGYPQRWAARTVPPCWRSCSWPRWNTRPAPRRISCGLTECDRSRTSWTRPLPPSAWMQAWWRSPRCRPRS